MRRDVDLDPQSSHLEVLAPRALRREIERMFEELLEPVAPLGGAAPFVPTLEMTEADQQYVVRAELPGMTESDVQVEVDDDKALTIRGEKRSETAETRGGCEYSERSYGRFVRTIRLPPAVDASKIEASFRNGVLELHVPKSAHARSRAIPIGKHASESAGLAAAEKAQKAEKPPAQPSPR